MPSLPTAPRRRYLDSSRAQSFNQPVPGEGPAGEPCPIRLRGSLLTFLLVTGHLSLLFGVQLNGRQAVSFTSQVLQSKPLRLSPPPVILSGEMKSTSNRKIRGHIFSFPFGGGQGNGSKKRVVPIHRDAVRRHSVRMYAPCLAAWGGMFDHSAVKRSPSTFTRYSLPVDADFQT